MSTENQKIDIILDCDPGYDDAAAILLAAGNPNVNILAITVVAGNQSIAKVRSFQGYWILESST